MTLAELMLFHVLKASTVFTLNLQMTFNCLDILDWKIFENFLHVSLYDVKIH